MTRSQPIFSSAVAYTRPASIHDLLAAARPARGHAARADRRGAARAPRGDRAHRLRLARVPDGRDQPLPPRMGRLRRHDGLRQRRGARGAARPGAPGRRDWEPLLDARFLQRGAYLVPYGEFDWDAVTCDRTRRTSPVSDDPNAWHPDDALFAPMRGADGTLLGILSVDEPISGRKPSGDEIDVLVAVSEHAALAVQAAQEASARARRTATRSSACSPSRRGSNETSRHARAPAARVRRRSRRRSASRRSPCSCSIAATGIHETVAAVGFEPTARTSAQPLAADELERLLSPSSTSPGCYLIPHGDGSAPAAARSPARLPLAARRPRPARVAEPLAVRAAARPPRRRIGYIWADDPHRPAAPGRRSACRSCARSRTRRRPRSSRQRSSRRSRTRTSTTAR